MGSSSSSSAAPAHHVLFLVGIIVLFVMFSWYMSYEAAYESVMDQLSLVSAIPYIKQGVLPGEWVFSCCFSCL
ncbi:hypothetical protein SUGI_0191010 [Cryptomeria japonica]|nr:hypothetical protein SUGI_0191010 [Cryptomeria japonica]